jgi:hypothetical protein
MNNKLQLIFTSNKADKLFLEILCFNHSKKIYRKYDQKKSKEIKKSQKKSKNQI